MLFEFLVNVQDLAHGRVKTRQQLPADNQNVDFAPAEFRLYRLFVLLGVLVLAHHAFPVRDDGGVTAFVGVPSALPRIRRRNHNRAFQIAHCLKTFQIAHGVPLIVHRQHSPHSRRLYPFPVMFRNVQRDTLHAGARGSQALNGAPSPRQVVALGGRQTPRLRLKPLVNVRLVRFLLHETPLVNQRDYRPVVYAVLNRVLVNQSAEFRQRVLFALHQRRACETYITGVREHNPHTGGHEAVIGAVAFVHEYEYVLRIVFLLLFLRRGEFVDNRRDNIRLVARNQLDKVSAAGRPRRTQSRMGECRGNLTIQLFPVRINHDFRMSRRQF